MSSCSKKKSHSSVLIHQEAREVSEGQYSEPRLSTLHDISTVRDYEPITHSLTETDRRVTAEEDDEEQ